MNDVWDKRSFVYFEGVYVLRNTVTGDCYVGQSADLVSRFKLHLWARRAGRSKNKELQASFILHGEAAFEFKVLEFCDTAPAHCRETYWINELNSVFNRYQKRVAK